MKLSDHVGCRIKLHDLHVLIAVVQGGSDASASLIGRLGSSTF
jgi:hypothetical protein